MDKEYLIKSANSIMEFNSPVCYFSPGRVNLIGEHIDYNGGFVLPCCIDLGTYGVMSLRNDEEFHCYSKNFPELGIMKFGLNDLVFNLSDYWINYVKGIVKALNIKKGFNLYVEGTLPTGAGLSSSASLELLVASLINDLYNLDLSNLEIVKICHTVENEFINVKCGIMDQYVIGMAKENSAILLNTTTLQSVDISLDLDAYQFVIANTMKTRTLASSKYNQRRAECEVGLNIIKNKVAIDNLCELNYRTFESISNLIKDEKIKRRIKHVIIENERTINASFALSRGEMIVFGKLMNESHESLKNDYEVSCFELDAMVDLLIKHNAIGARMTGAGFGGCAIALINKDIMYAVISEISKEYAKITSYEPEFYVVNIEKGVRKL